MAKKFDNVIATLEQIIEHWFDKEKLATIVNLKSGLCINLTDPDDDDYFVIEPSIDDCIRQYNLKHNKSVDASITLLFYPVELSFLHYSNGSDNATLYNNPKRFHLAVFMLAWFRQHNTESV